jgi:hypothetical protein
MIPRPTSRFSRATTISAALSLSMLCAGQVNTGASANPRSPADDPRINLKPGIFDAGEAAFGLERLMSLPKPAGFAPNTPGTTDVFPPPQSPDAKTDGPPRTVQYGSANSDLAFGGNHLFVGNYNGINFYDIDNPGKTALKTSLVCPGGQGDVSIYGHLLFMSAEAANGRTDCGTQGIALPEGYKPPPPPPPAADAARSAAAQPRSFSRRPHL